jgi:hypothetical protein
VLVLRSVGRSPEELVRERVGFILQAGLQGGKPLIHILFDRPGVADGGAHEREHDDDQGGGENPAHAPIGHLFALIGPLCGSQPAFESRCARAAERTRRATGAPAGAERGKGPPRVTA